LSHGIGERMEQGLHRAGIFTVARLRNAMPFHLRRVWDGINGLRFHQMPHAIDIPPPLSHFSKSTPAYWGMSDCRRRTR
jgi:nucleotidyltransferase/DNA polymerase involved in DNA repair